MKLHALLSCLLIAFAALLFAKPAEARYVLSKGVGYSIEPIVGYDTVYRPSPTPHTSTRSVFGLRVVAGVDLLSGEVEYTKGTDTEEYQTAPEKIKYTDDNYKLGVRSTYRFNEYFFATGRLGGQATKTTREETSGGVTTTTEDPMEYNPYAGANAGVRVGPISVSLGATAVIRDIKDTQKNDIQYNISFGLSN